VGTLTSDGISYVILGKSKCGRDIQILDFNGKEKSLFKLIKYVMKRVTYRKLLLYSSAIPDSYKLIFRK